jgi:hypothetical protein
LFENRVLRRIFGQRGMEEQENGESRTMRSFIFYAPPQILLGRSNQGECGGRDMWHVWERREMCTGFYGKARRKETTWKTKA